MAERNLYRPPLPMSGFVTFHVLKPANGFERGWYYLATGALHNEPVGPYPTKQAAEAAAAART